MSGCFDQLSTVYTWPFKALNDIGRLEILQPAILLYVQMCKCFVGKPDIAILAASDITVY